MSRLLTWVLRALPILGLALVLIGSQEWYPETWLDSKGFVINLASGLTAACFGVPIAFFVLQKLLTERATHEDRLRAVTFASDNMDSIERHIAAIHGLTPEILHGKHTLAINRFCVDLRNLRDLVRTMTDEVGPVYDSRKTRDAIGAVLRGAPFDWPGLTPQNAGQAAGVGVERHRSFVVERLFSVGLTPTSDETLSAIEGIIARSEPAAIFSDHFRCAVRARYILEPLLEVLPDGELQPAHSAAIRTVRNHEGEGVCHLEHLIGEWETHLRSADEKITQVFLSLKVVREEQHRLKLLESKT